MENFDVDVQVVLLHRSEEQMLARLPLNLIRRMKRKMRMKMKMTTTTRL